MLDLDLQLFRVFFKSRSWIQIGNKSFPIYNTQFNYNILPEPWVDKWQLLFFWNFCSFDQYYGSGSVFQIRMHTCNKKLKAKDWRPFIAGLWIRMDSHSFSLLDRDPHSMCGSGSRRVNLSIKNWKKCKEIANNCYFIKFFKK